MSSVKVIGSCPSSRGFCHPHARITVRGGASLDETREPILLAVDPPAEDWVLDANGPVGSRARCPDESPSVGPCRRSDRTNRPPAARGHVRARRRDDRNTCPAGARRFRPVNASLRVVHRSPARSRRSSSSAAVLSPALAGSRAHRRNAGCPQHGRPPQPSSLGSTCRPSRCLTNMLSRRQGGRGNVPPRFGIGWARVSATTAVAQRMRELSPPIARSSGRSMAGGRVEKKGKSGRSRAEREKKERKERGGNPPPRH